MQSHASLSVGNALPSPIPEPGAPARDPLSPSPDTPATIRQNLHRYIRLQLVTLGIEEHAEPAQGAEQRLAHSLLANYRQRTRLLRDYRCPADTSIEQFLNTLCRQQNLPADLRLPGETFSLSEPGLARELAFPPGGDQFDNAYVHSYRLRNGVLHNPRSDRRTTKGTFHIADIGLPVPGDKVAVPFPVFVSLFRHALNPPDELLTLPFTADRPQPARLFCSLLLRPIVCPEIPGLRPEQTMEIRFFAPGSLVSNLDFVESIFGNAGDPVLPENDARLDVTHWTGHTGCIILAPHLVNLTKAQLGLPRFDQATDRQRRDGACWQSPDERYNDGQAFKITCRSSSGVMVTLIADNYFGYCKKEVKTQISFAANLMGSAEEEHSGGAIAFPSYSQGTEYHPLPIALAATSSRAICDLARQWPQIMDAREQGHAVDRRFSQLIYIPADASLDLRTGSIDWQHNGEARSIPLRADRIYMTPTGQRFFLSRHPGSGRFRIVTTLAHGTFCHKPCTVSGGGKSEISKSLLDYMIYGPIHVTDLDKDLDQVEQVFRKDHSQRWKPGLADVYYAKATPRTVLDSRRSLGSTIKLLTPSPDYTDAYNAWLHSIPSEILALVFLVKRLYKPEWGENWREHFTVDIVNGEPGHELKVDDRKAGGSYLRVGLLPGGGWRTFKLRQDFYPAAKIQTEDDITASTVIPARWISESAAAEIAGSVKLVANCEQRLFQRPDDAIHPGLDRQTEFDFARSDNFFSNYEPLTPQAVQQIVDRIADFDLFSPPMQELLKSAAEAEQGLTACPARPRVIDGKPSKNPRYLQLRPDLARPVERYIAEMGARLARNLPLDAPVVFPVDAVLIGRRNNPPDVTAGIRNLAVYNPIHYQELPEFFMDVICSLTGKSPSTTGAGSEGAMTKGPFNALFTTADLNAALCCFILTGLAGYSTAAGHIGPQRRIDHDISLLVPEIWCRLSPQERNPAALIASGCLERLDDLTHNGTLIPASRLGYRITYQFVRTYFGRLFDNPTRVLDEAMLRPETQSMDAFVDGILNIAQAQQRVALQYFEDGSIQQACPPLRALLSIMAYGQFEAKDVHHADIRALFTREHLLASDWYRQRLHSAQQRDIQRWQRCLDYLTDWTARQSDEALAAQLDIPARLAHARRELDRASAATYPGALAGTLGADPV